MHMPIRVILPVALFVIAPLLTANAAVPGATCRKGTDRPESGLQGETTQAEVDSGASKLGFHCNVDLVGSVQGEGANWQLAAWKNCAYYDQSGYALSKIQHPGTVVVDVSDPAHPQITDYLTSPAMLDPWESLKVNAKRQLLAGDQGTYPTAGPGFSIYDISGDCRHPVLQSAVNLPGSSGHTGQWAPDGNTYYITPLKASTSLLPVDTTDTTNPKVIPCGAGTTGCNSSGFWVAPPPLNPIFHDLELSKDGNTAYVAMIASAGCCGGLPPTVPNGLLILDVSDIQSRKANPAIRVLGSIDWDDGSVAAQNALPVTIGGKPYIIFTDEGGLGAAGCSQGKSAYGFPRLIDVSDPRAPKVVSKVQLEVQDPVNCTRASSGILWSPSAHPSYSTHYCNVDNSDNATIMACSNWGSGLRIFDIRNPLNPKEIGYYKPPGQGTKALYGSVYFTRLVGGDTSFDRPVDLTPAKPSFPKDRGMTTGDIWMTSQDNGFQVVRFDQGGGGCSSAGGSLGAIVGLAVLGLLRRQRR